MHFKKNMRSRVGVLLTPIWFDPREDATISILVIVFKNNSSLRAVSNIAFHVPNSILV